MARDRDLDKEHMLVDVRDLVRECKETISKAIAENRPMIASRLATIACELEDLANEVYDDIYNSGEIIE